MSEPHLDDARWLVTPDGLAVLARTTSALDAGHDELAIGSRLRAEGHHPSRAAMLLSAAVARRHARHVWDDADALLVTREALEQASDPRVSRWRARRFAHAPTWDLCAGIGGDAMQLGTVAEGLTAVERDPTRAVLLQHNLRVRGLDATCVTGDALAQTVPQDALIHVDPARRRNGRRLRLLADLEPSVPDLLVRHHHVAGLGVVVSPAVDLTDPDLPDGELEFLQVDDQLVEAVVWIGDLRRPATAATATLLPAGIERCRADEPRVTLPVGGLGEWLVEVTAAAVRARLHDEIGAEIDARRVAAHRALLTCDGAPADSPWYRARPVLAVLPARPKAVRRWLDDHDPAPVELAFHGLPGDVAGWWRELGRPPRGPRGLRIEVVRLDDGATAVITAADGGRPARGR